MKAKITKNIADNGAVQANDNATQIVNVNPNDAKVKLALKIEELEAEKQKWIDDELAKHGSAMIKSVHTQAAARYDARLASLRKAYGEL